ncbi:hypothetical protein CH373_09990 [Leptospira perolatii]|uniref:DUF1577 domain-containing protein n=1 Tax=Leptospira perolatii TaxID=2023191 RepID=A0A2M9ZN20_9LEPT|nr:DUF1577 domain-containing protein [Leptospira perolatii]PJZ70185.1 hypothetical protein CH360_07735 [Leptospira perolatii]PJZ73404.1 hypothetical protein CH373_09990 [Leptospira perolatii]
MEKVERKKRDREIISEPQKKLHIIGKFLVKTELLIRDTEFNDSVELLSVSNDAKKILVQAHKPDLWTLHTTVVLYKLLARYVELECKVLEEKGNMQYILSVESVSIASKDRKFPRIKPPDGSVWITNLRTSRTTIDANSFNIPTSVKVNFADYETKLKPKFDLLKVDIFRSIGDKFDLVKKTGKILYIPNTQKPTSYNPPDKDGYIDYFHEIGGDEEDVRRKIVEYANQKIKSELIVPIIYVNHDEQAIPIGYVHAQTRTREIDMTEVMEIKTLTFEMVDRIRESNTMLVKERFPVLDLSTGGLRIKINHPELMTELPKRIGFTFDIFFKLQAPLTAYGVIRSVAKDADNNLYIGLSLEGNSSRPGEKKRYMDNVTRLLGDAGIKTS